MPTIHTSALSGQEVMTLLEDYIQDAIPEVIGFVMSVIGAILVYVIGVRVIKFLRKVLTIEFHSAIFNPLNALSRNQ